MHRFFLPPEQIQHDTAVIEGAPVHQIRNVLRLRPGDCVVILDNSGWEYEVELGEMDSRRVEGRVKCRRKSLGEPRTRVNLYQAVLKGSKFEIVLQKGTEIGISGFVPMICQRSIARDFTLFESRLERWRKIILEAAEQSGRGRLPELHAPMVFQEACRNTSGLSILPWEGEPSLSLRNMLSRIPQNNPPSVNLFIGPEGGFDPSEVELARNAGIATVTLGHRTLRAETAGLVAAAAIFYEMGDLEK